MKKSSTIQSSLSLVYVFLFEITAKVYLTGSNFYQRVARGLVAVRKAPCIGSLIAWVK